MFSLSCIQYSDRSLALTSVRHTLGQLCIRAAAHCQCGVYCVIYGTVLRERAVSREIVAVAERMLLPVIGERARERSKAELSLVESYS